MSEPSSSVSCPSGEEEAKLEKNPPPRKRGASISSESDKSHPCIKALRTGAEVNCDSVFPISSLLQKHNYNFFKICFFLLKAGRGPHNQHLR